VDFAILTIDLDIIVVALRLGFFDFEFLGDLFSPGVLGVALNGRFLFLCRALLLLHFDAARRAGCLAMAGCPDVGVMLASVVSCFVLISPGSSQIMANVSDKNAQFGPLPTRAEGSNFRPIFVDWIMARTFEIGAEIALAARFGALWQGRLRAEGEPRRCPDIRTR
jgi:hypothetical protein